MTGDEIGRGAEAVVTHCEYLGRSAVVKTRPMKGYRHPDLDRHIRTVRTKNEVRVMRESRMAGVRTPVIYDVDLEKCSITMEFIKGESVKSILDSHPERTEEICAKIGALVARLHNGGVSHGDLTTSNMIVTDDSEICLIDLSLGSTKIDIEDMGVDIRLMERAFTSAHSGLSDAFSKVMDSYRANMPIAEKVMAKVEEIKGRARYT